MNLLAKLKTLFEDERDADSDPDPVARAVATILLEVAASDHPIEDDELGRIRVALGQRFGLTEAGANALLEDGLAEHGRSVGMYDYTSTLNGALDPDQKVELIAELWELALMDDELHRYEDHVIRRIAELLYVSHADFIAAKQTARRRVGKQPRRS